MLSSADTNMSRNRRRGHGKGNHAVHMDETDGRYPQNRHSLRLDPKPEETATAACQRRGQSGRRRALATDDREFGASA